MELYSTFLFYLAQLCKYSFLEKTPRPSVSGILNTTLRTCVYNLVALQSVWCSLLQRNRHCLFGRNLYHLFPGSIVYPTKEGEAWKSRVEAKQVTQMACPLGVLSHAKAYISFLNDTHWRPRNFVFLAFSGVQRSQSSG